MSVQDMVGCSMMAGMGAAGLDGVLCVDTNL